MATYWVKYNYNFTVEAGGVASPPRPPLEFLGQQLDYFSDPVVQILVDPTPATTFDNISLFYDQFLEERASNPAPGEIYRLFVHVSISDWFLVGSAPSPSELLGPTAISPSLPPALSQGIPYNTFAWAKISIDDSIVSITADQPTGVPEGNSGNTPITFTVHLSAPLPTGSSPLVVSLIPNANDGGPRQYANSQLNTDWALGDTSVTFNAGDQNKTVTVYAKGDTLPEPNEIFKLGVGILVAPSGAHVTTNSLSDVATGTILNDDTVSVSDRLTAHITVDGSLSSVNGIILDALKADLQAALDRISKELPGGRSHDVSISLTGANLGDVVAAGTSFFVQANAAGSASGPLAVPKTLVEYVTGSDPERASPDIIVAVNLQKLDKYYNGGTDGGGTDLSKSYDMTTVLTHELLHGFGLGVAKNGASVWEKGIIDHHYVGHRSGSVALTAGSFDQPGSGTFRESSIARRSPSAGSCRSISTNRRQQRPCNSHIGGTDLMAPGYPGANKTISDTDVLILQDMGYTPTREPDDLQFTMTSGKQAAFRFFDSATGDHFYTLSAAEANQIRATLPTYHDEGTPWSTPNAGPNDRCLSLL
jgi:Repeat of unknown function (DUF5648)